jgi:phosphoribosylformylglycinamidine synthase
MTETPTKITPEIIAAQGLTEEEYQRICGILGREPNFTELGIFGAMWSEHCSYKNSKRILKLLPTEGKGVLVKAGEENAGVIDLGDGLAIVFKIESHNHPSAVEPFQGAATGVGGILRDIFTMGARPVLLMNSLRFGPLESKESLRHFKGVVAGIAHYGNCIGVPTVGGEIYFDEAYEGNPLVNAMCLGIVRVKEMAKAKATGAGNKVYYVGSATGRDGLGGASFASRELTEESEEDRPAVQVGDPFMEKLLLEACLELVKTDALVGMQDMGAAGLTCGTCETAARGNSAIAIDVGKVPRRETGMIPYEVMLSESQERMIVIAKKGKEKAVEEIFEKWDLHAVPIGEVLDGHLMKVFDQGELVAEIPAKALADEAPVYIREETRPGYLDDVQGLDLSGIKEPQDFTQVLKRLLDSPSIASKEWVYEKYDHMVRTDTVFLPGHDAALLRVKGTRKGIAVSTDCNGLYCYLDPYEGGKIAVAESARNVAVTGARPVGLTNCLNFGNPMKPEIFWQFHQCVQGMADACRRFGIPVTGGNVSFYNENPKGAVYPTPVIGVVGILDDIENRIPSHFQTEGDLLFLLGETADEIGGSAYLALLHGLKKGVPPRLDLEKEAKLQALFEEAARLKLFRSAHDLSEGGLAVALAESAFGGAKLGARVTNLELLGGGLRRDALLFGETQSRVLVSTAPERKEAVIRLAQRHGVPTYQIGKVTGNRLIVEDLIELKGSEAEAIWRNAIRRRI